MHSLYFVKIKEAKDAEDAKMQAVEALDSNGFASEGGFFSSSKADWYVVGGRWSGELQELQLGINFYKEAEKVIKKESNFGFSHAELENLENKKTLQTLWKKLGGTGENPLSREQYRQRGYDDDAMQITPEILKALQNKEYEQVEVFDADNFDEYLVKDLENSLVGEWLVVIDYHM